MPFNNKKKKIDYLVVINISKTAVRIIYTYIQRKKHAFNIYFFKFELFLLFSKQSH